MTELIGKFVRLEPLERRHVKGLVAAAQEDPSLYRWSPVPQSAAAAASYVDTAMAGLEAGTAVPFATIDASNGAVIGSTRFFNCERWAWPEGHPLAGRMAPTVCEIGYTWLARKSVRTAANTEAKLLMLTHAFETWQVQRVCFHTDIRNERSRSAIERIGGRFEGVLRAHRIAADHTARDSARYSIIASEWMPTKQRLRELLRDDPIAAPMVVGPPTEPRDFTCRDTLKNGVAVTIRALRADDRERLVSAFRLLDPESVYRRFFSYKNELSEAELARIRTANSARDVALIVTVGAGRDEIAIGSGRYIGLAAGAAEQRAEVAFTVLEEYRNLGIAGRLLASLADIARNNGITSFEAEVLPENRSMLAVFARSGLPMRLRPAEGYVCVTLDLRGNRRA